MKPFFLLITSGILVCLVSCESPVPRDDSFEHFYNEYMSLIEPELEELKVSLDEGAISQRAYDQKVAELTGNVTEEVNHLIYKNHQLREMSWRAKGLPTAGHTVSPHMGGGHHGGVGSGFGSQAGFGSRGFGGGGGHGNVGAQLPGNAATGGFGTGFAHRDIGRVY